MHTLINLSDQKVFYTTYLLLDILYNLGHFLTPDVLKQRTLYRRHSCREAKNYLPYQKTVRCDKFQNLELQGGVQFFSFFPDLNVTLTCVFFKKQYKQYKNQSVQKCNMRGPRSRIHQENDHNTTCWRGNHVWKF
jgi:hypothetical protein